MEFCLQNRHDLAFDAVGDGVGWPAPWRVVQEAAWRCAEHTVRSRLLFQRGDAAVEAEEVIEEDDVTGLEREATRLRQRAEKTGKAVERLREQLREAEARLVQQRAGPADDSTVRGSVQNGKTGVSSAADGRRCGDPTPRSLVTRWVGGKLSRRRYGARNEARCNDARKDGLSMDAGCRLDRCAHRLLRQWMCRGG